MGEALPAIERLDRQVEASTTEDLLGAIKRQPVDRLVDRQRRQHLRSRQRAIDDPLLGWGRYRHLALAGATRHLLAQVLDHFELGRGVLDDEAAHVSDRAPQLATHGASTVSLGDSDLMTLRRLERTAPLFAFAFFRRLRVLLVVVLFFLLVFCDDSFEDLSEETELCGINFFAAPAEQLLAQLLDFK
jgi:hypothetical protein